MKRHKNKLDPKKSLAHKKGKTIHPASKKSPEPKKIAAPKKTKEAIKQKLSNESKKLPKEDSENLKDSQKGLEKSKISQKIEENYKVESEYFQPKIQIVSREGELKKYELILPALTVSTKAFLDEIRHKLVTGVGVVISEIFDPASFLKLKDEIRKKTISLINQKMPQINSETRNFLVQTLINEMFGLGDIEYLLDDPNLEEVIILSSKETVRIYHKNLGWLETNLTIPREEQIQNYSSIIGRRVGRQISILNPLLDAHLITGDRTNAVLYPISTKGNTITIRKFRRDPWTVTNLIQNKTCSSEVFALIWLAIQYEMSVLFSGGTASGKTTFMNVCMAFVPPNHRLISIEQTRELQLPKFLYWCPLITREPNPEGKGEVSMLDLLVNSLRMRPDRIILGEVRRKKEAEVLFEAMHTGHSVYATLHANSISETIQRLIHPPIEVPANLLAAVDLNVVMFRDRRRGLRRPYHVGEFIPSETKTGFTITPNILYRWKPTTDKIVPHAKSLRLFEDLSRNIGFSKEEIDRDLKEKQMILNWMVKNNIYSVEQVGQVIKDYYLNKEALLKRIPKNVPTLKKKSIPLKPRPIVKVKPSAPKEQSLPKHVQEPKVFYKPKVRP